MYGSLTKPFRLSRDIPQVCGLSRILYAIGTEPLLIALRNKYGDISAVCPSISDMITIRLSAYADEVTVFIRFAQDVANLKESLEA